MSAIRLDDLHCSKRYRRGEWAQGQLSVCNRPLSLVIAQCLLEPATMLFAGDAAMPVKDEQYIATLILREQY